MANLNQTAAPIFSRQAANRRSALPSCFARALACVLIFAFALSALSRAADDDANFNVHKLDEIVLKGGKGVLRGSVYPQDDGSFRVVEPNGIARVVPKDEVLDVRKKATKEDEFDRLAKKYAADPVNMLRIAKEAVTKWGLSTKVIPVLERFVSVKPDEGVMQFLGSLYLNAGQAEKAQRIGEKLVEKGPDKPHNLILRGQAYADLDRLDDAEKDLVKAYKSAPQDDEVVLAYANLLMRRGKADAAKKIFSDVVAASPRNASALSGLGFVQIRTGDFSAAEQTFQDALQIKPDFLKALIGLATAEMMNKKYDDAFTLCTTILNIDTNSAEAMAIQAMALIYKGDPASLEHVEEKNYIRDSLELKPNQPRLQLAWAVMLDREAKYEDFKSTKEKNAGVQILKKNASLAKFNEVLNSDAPDSYIQYWIGERRFREAEEARRRNDTGAYDAAMAKAEAAYQRAAKLSPSYAPVNDALGATLLRRRKFEDARAVFAKAAAADSTSPDAADYFAGQGLALLGTRKIEEASAFFKKALELDPNNAPAFCGKGYIANWERNKDRAIEYFQKALAADGDCSYAANALQLIYKQDDREMEYVHFTGTEFPAGWKPYHPGGLKLVVSGGQAVIAGTQGLAQGTRVELYRQFPTAAKFERLEADLTINPNTLSQFGLRIASGTGPSPAFELQFGKDETNEIKVWIKDSAVAVPEWHRAGGHEWPRSGRARLSIETTGIAAPETEVHLYINGAPIGTVKLTFQIAPKSFTLGTFLIASPKETVNAAINNIVIVKKGVTESMKNGGGDEKFVAEPEKTDKPDEKKPDEKK